VALDLPGFGQTPLPRRPWGTFEYGDCVASLLRRSGLPACTLVGHSFGGRVAIAVAARSPELVGKLVLVDSAGIVPRRSPSYYVRVSMVKLARTVLSLPGLGRLRPRVMAALHRRVGSSDYRALVDPIQRAIFVRVVNEDVRHLLPRVPVPTLLIWGDQDRETPLADGRLMERLIPDAGLVVFEGAGHFSYLERLDQFCRVLAHFAGSP
jgi:pimeloyl-ACP methyl ester carboxylesterase